MTDDCSVIKRNRLVLTPLMWVNLSDVVRVKEARYKRTKYCTIPFLGGSKRGKHLNIGCLWAVEVGEGTG